MSSYLFAAFGSIVMHFSERPFRVASYIINRDRREEHLEIMRSRGVHVEIIWHEEVASYEQGLEMLAGAPEPRHATDMLRIPVDRRRPLIVMILGIAEDREVRDNKIVNTSQ